MTRTGEYHENEVIETVDGEAFERCHFYHCEFAHRSRLTFSECVFIMGVSFPEWVGQFGDSRFERCLAGYEPKG